MIEKAKKSPERVNLIGNNWIPTTQGDTFAGKLIKNEYVQTLTGRVEIEIIYDIFETGVIVRSYKRGASTKQLNEVPHIPEIDESVPTVIGVAEGTIWKSKSSWSINYVQVPPRPASRRLAA